MKIRQAGMSDIDNIHELERKIEKQDAASRETLISRLQVFNLGFRIAEIDGRIVGYIESCLWNKEDFETFSEIRNFPSNHDPDGQILYIIFLGVDKYHRRNGIGSKLVESVANIAVNYGMKKVQLVAGDRKDERGPASLVEFYKRLGFNTVKRLPKFLPSEGGTLMEYPLR